MTIQQFQKVEYYYDSHPTPEDLMGQSPLHSLISKYLIELLNWLFHVENWYVAYDLNIYSTLDKKEKPIVPDVAVFIGVTESSVQHPSRRSWSLAEGDPVPSVVFEIWSKETGSEDVKVKPGKYAAMGVPEYFAYDPRPRVRGRTAALRGWQCVDGRDVEMQADDQGWIWSRELQSWLGVDIDARRLRLYDINRVMRLTGEEAAVAEANRERTAKEAERMARLQLEEKLQKALSIMRDQGIDTSGL